MLAKEPKTITEAIHAKSDKALSDEIRVAVQSVRSLFGAHVHAIKLPIGEGSATPGSLLEAVAKAAFAHNSESRRVDAVTAFMAKVEELDAMQRYPEGE